MLVRAGYRAVMPDLRGHGRSTGETLSYGVFEARDLADTLDALVAGGLAHSQVGVMGNSYGAAVAVQWAGADPRVRAVVAVAPFATMREAVAGYLPLRIPATFVRRATDAAGLRGGFDPDAASAVDAMRRTSARVLLMHGLKDERIPPWHSERIHAARPDLAEVVLIEGASHRNICGAPSTRLADRAAAWFKDNLE
jgi:pimeloyl-ACP methyl ester carboxylesterase